MEQLRIKQAEFHFDVPLNIHIVGCGGIGGWFIPGFLKTMSQYFESNPDTMIRLWDPDTVESRNITRQNFILSDIGKPKAEVLATRYGAAYGISDYITYENQRFSPTQIGWGDMIFAFVDDPEARFKISINTPGAAAYTDVGNERKAGQAYVQVSNDRTGKTNAKLVDVFPDLLTAKKEVSCANDAQNLYINHIGADVALNISRELLFEKSINGILTFYGIGRVQRTLTSKDVKDQIIKTRPVSTEREEPMPIEEFIQTFDEIEGLQGLPIRPRRRA